jgi:catechol 2,3-dioxygenase-like lactoylglutathione lyase family enzyme
MRLNQVMVGARDLPASIAFYQALGLKLIVRSEDYARFVCPDGGSTFSLHLEPQAKGVSQTVVYFEDEALDATVAKLKGKGLTIEAEPADQRWLWREAYLRDPTGNLVCLYLAGENRLNPPWRIKD